MDAKALNAILTGLIAQWENEVIEFKEATDSFSTNDIGKYVSSLSNEANLHGLEKAWLVFGVSNKTRKVTGTSYRAEPERLNGLKQQIAESTDPGIHFRGLHVLDHVDGRVVMMEIPAAPRGIPIAWKGHYYARAGESLVSLPLDKLDAIRAQTLNSDWTGQVADRATADDLDPTALAVARASFARKHANHFADGEVAGWPLDTFLDRARLTIHGRITRAALLLIGKAESASLLLPHPAQLTWKLEGPERAYEHFGPPFLLTTTQLFQRIRNIRLRLLPDNTLLPDEVQKYDQTVVMEALHNCIAHQDYRRDGRVIVTEWPDRLVLENEGGFFEGRPEDYVTGVKTPRRYRNPFLAQAMVELNMIDTMGYGIHRMYLEQQKRYFPMPDYDLSSTDAVSLSVPGKVVDPAYTQLLMQNTGLPLVDVLALDRVQKRLPLTDDAVKRLKKAGLIEGRKPNFHVSAMVAAATSGKAQYIKTRGFDDQHYESLITDYLRKFGKASRKDIDELVLDRLSDALTVEQKMFKIGNILSKLRRKNIIYNAGGRSTGEWRLAD